jgi:hypothetical protein
VCAAAAAFSSGHISPEVPLQIETFYCANKEKGLFCGRRRCRAAEISFLSLPPPACLLLAPRKNNNSALFITGTAGKNEKFHRRRQISPARSLSRSLAVATTDFQHTALACMRLNQKAGCTIVLWSFARPEWIIF